MVGARGGPPDELPPLRDRIDADVVIVGGGYLGMWTAWHLLERDAGRAHRAGREGPLRVRAVGAQRRVRVAVLGEARHSWSRSSASGGRARWPRRPGRRSTRSATGAVERRRRLVPQGGRGRARDRALAGGRCGEGVDACARLRAAPACTSSCRARRCVARAVAAVRRRRDASGRRRPCSRRGWRSGCASGCSSAACGSSSARRSCGCATGGGVDVAGGGSVRAPRVVLAVNHVAG